MANPAPGFKSHPHHETPDDLGTFREAFAHGGGPAVIGVVVTHDPAGVLPAASSRAVDVEKGDRVA